MIDLEDRIHRYAEAVADPAALGPDPAEIDGAGRVYGRPGRLALVACLVVLVAVVGGLLVVSGRDQSPTPAADRAVTETQQGDRLAVSLTVTDSYAAFGGTLTANAVLTNTSTEPITVLTAPSFTLDINWGPISRAGSPIDPTTLEKVAVPYSSTSFNSASGAAAEMAPDAFDPQARVTLDPGDSVSIDGTRVVDESMRTGSVEVAITPTAIEVIDGRESLVGLADMTVTLPVTVGPAPAGTITLPDAVAAALADPQLASWGAAVDAAGGAVGGGASTVEPSGDGWRILNGATDGNAGPDLEAELRQHGGPGFIVRVDAEQTVTVDWIAGP